jgi:hypothetical protein
VSSLSSVSVCLSVCVSDCVIACVSAHAIKIALTGFDLHRGHRTQQPQCRR